ncbi:MAG: ferrous iron transporter B [Magnetococcales bacterium]|nr:ferrous iron transporter B [Magnetococcales bacterium]MBF0115848.1 ferrous iron transporter B [Magnetococcales bacterium]
MESCHALPGIGAGTGNDSVPFRVVIVGRPNSGKSLIFNELTKVYSIVANYPQTTVAPSSQVIDIFGRSVLLVDTPGVSSLLVNSPDERSTLDALIGQRPDGVLFCSDAMHLKQSLMLLVQVMELGLPTVCCLNKVDDTAACGMIIDSAALSATLSVPVVELSAAHGFGFDALKSSLRQLMESKASYRDCSVPVSYQPFFQEMATTIRSLFPLESRPSCGLILLYLQGDQTASNWVAKTLADGVLCKLQGMVEEFRQKYPANRVGLLLFQNRLAFVEQLTGTILRQASYVPPSPARHAERLCRHPVYGWFIFLAILWMTFKGVGIGAADLGGWLDSTLFSPATQLIGENISYPLLNEFLVGQFGLLTMGLANAMVTVVPILAIFFLIVNLLEDVGYLPNLSVLANRTLRPFGLTGKAVLPLVLGTGCNTTATMSSRILETKKERLLVSFLVALGVPCSVQLGILMAILATMPFSALLLVLGSVLLTTVACGLLMNHLVRSGKKKVVFIQELPSFHWPHWRNILLKTYYRVKWFLVEAVPMFMVAALTMFVMEKSGLLQVIKQLLHPLITGFLSLPDKTTEVFILVLARREVGAVYFKQMVESGEIDYVQIVTGLIVITLFIPCVSNTMVMLKEYGVRWAVSTNLAIIAIAVLVGGAVNHLLRLFV